MKKKYKLYLKLNLMSIFFIFVSLISVTLAWFAYSGLATVETEIGVKAWYVEFDNSKIESNELVLSLKNIYPGMETVNEVVKIKNLGDSDAQLKYSIKSVRILDKEYVLDENNTSAKLEDQISHDYPFHINMNITKNFAKAKGDESIFDVSISWPLDSDDDKRDSDWGTDAYNFLIDEQAKHDADSNYQIRTSLKVVISLTAEQYIDGLEESPDLNYKAGDLVLYDVLNNRSCDKVSDTCIITHVIDSHSTLADKTVRLLPDLYADHKYGKLTTAESYSNLFKEETTGWLAETEPLTAKDLLTIISRDIVSSKLIRDGLSDDIIGDLAYENRFETEILKATNPKYNGYYTFNNDTFSYLNSNRCYWTNTSYNDNKVFALTKVNDTTSKIYGENKDTECYVVPIIKAPKSNIVKGE